MKILFLVAVKMQNKLSSIVFDNNKGMTTTLQIGALFIKQLEHIAKTKLPWGYETVTADLVKSIW